MEAWSKDVLTSQLQEHIYTSPPSFLFKLVLFVEYITQQGSAALNPMKPEQW